MKSASLLVNNEFIQICEETILSCIKVVPDLSGVSERNQQENSVKITGIGAGWLPDSKQTY
jgi:hypothetical protein